MKLVTDIITEKEKEKVPDSEAWLLWHARDMRTENLPVLVPKFELNEGPTTKQTLSKDDIFDGWVSGLQKNKQDEEKKSKSVYKLEAFIINWL